METTQDYAEPNHLSSFIQNRNDPIMNRTLSIKNLYDKKHKLFSFDGIWGKVLGSPERNGIWIIWGAEKNGKTWFALLLANYLRLKGDKVLYISAEEGTGSAFKEACKRAKIEPGAGLNFKEYEPLEEISEYLKKRKSAKVVFIDNITFYLDELKNGALRRLKNEHPNVLFIFLAHEERGEPYTATAKLCKKIAAVIMHVQGLACIVSGRCPGGMIMVDEEKAQIYHGQAA